MALARGDCDLVGYNDLTVGAGAAGEPSITLLPDARTRQGSDDFRSSLAQSDEGSPWLKC